MLFCSTPGGVYACHIAYDCKFVALGGVLDFRVHPPAVWHVYGFVIVCYSGSPQVALSTLYVRTPGGVYACHIAYDC